MPFEEAKYAVDSYFFLQYWKNSGYCLKQYRRVISVMQAAPIVYKNVLSIGITNLTPSV